MGRTITALALIAVGLLVLAGCGDSGRSERRGDAPTEEAACILAVDYDGHRYVGTAAPVTPVGGRKLGTATRPGCGDTMEGPEPDETEVEVAAIQGVSPDVAILERGRTESVLIRDDVDSGQLPTELIRVLRAPDCSSGQEPVTVSGRWLGIIGADGHTELDLDPPYDVRIKVDESSFPDYTRAALTVRVPARLGRPLSRKDIESSLWEGGTLTATVSCTESRFVASTIRASAPG
jgi:Family of unknown function (DUF6281)